MLRCGVGHGSQERQRVSHGEMSMTNFPEAQFPCKRVRALETGAGKLHYPPLIHQALRSTMTHLKSPS